MKGNGEHLHAYHWVKNYIAYDSKRLTFMEVENYGDSKMIHGFQS